MAIYKTFIYFRKARLSRVQLTEWNALDVKYKNSNDK